MYNETQILMELRRAELKRTILARIQGNDPIDFGREGVIVSLATAINAQPEF